MRQIQRQFAFEWMLLAGLLPICRTAIAGQVEQFGAPGNRMLAIVAAVRAEEAKYRDIEYSARIVVRDSARKDAADPAEVTTLATRRVVLQGDRSYVRYEARERTPLARYRWELLCADDGERTRTVTANNCVNIHHSRFIHPDIYPAHGLPLAHYKINFPLSVYLAGTGAIRAHLKYPTELADTGSINVFARVVARFEGEEPIDGLRCVKVRVDRWFPPYDDPFPQYLWLAAERNYHCVQEQYPGPDKRVRHDMHVAELREISPGVWFPFRITVREYDVQQPVGRNPDVVKRSEETTILKVDLAPKYETAFFRDIPIPADLPVFEIKDRTLVGSTLPDRSDGAGAGTKLLELARRAGEQEKRYEDIEIKAHVRSGAVNSHYQWAPWAEELWEDRSIIKGELARFTTNRMQATSTGWQRTLYQAEAYDGRWSRTLWGYDPQKPEGLGVVLRRGGVKIDDGGRDGIFVYRPHGLLLRDFWIFGSMAGLLSAPRLDRIGQTTLRFRYCGTADVDGHPCIKVCGDMTSQRAGDLYSGLVLYLATDLNFIPIKHETYAGNQGNRLMPNNLERCGDFREIAPGLWYPFHVKKLRFELGTHMGQGWILVTWRRDYTIDSVMLTPKLDQSVFSDVIAPAGANVQVCDEKGRTVGQLRQAESGIPAITDAHYRELLSEVPK